MSDDFFDRISKLSPKRLALLALELHEKLEATKKTGEGAAGDARAPIAVVGAGCRMPGGADDPEALWRLLEAGRDVIREVPADRFDIDDYFDPDPDAPASIATRSGGFLDAIDGFDASFFGIAPREALTMDPQQRMLMEVAWEALENAGIGPEGLAGSRSSVFVGVCNSDYFQRVLSRGQRSIDAWVASGSGNSVASGRISYFLGLGGPAMSIDTACSSSLVALHVACRSLRSGESNLALAAGVNVVCMPETMIALSQAHMLAPDGRCKTFDAAADGFARGEGCGVLVLKRLDDAIAAGDRVLAVIRGTAVNQDGRSGGLTVPNGPAQEAVIRAALADAGIGPEAVDYVEAHGTGTSLGDPIEVRALAGALGAGRAPDRPLVIGSIKTNMGHLESAAGIAGALKLILSLGHERIPPHLHFKNPSPQIAWADYPVRVEPPGRPWPRGPRRRLAGVSSFGFSGTNAHVIFEEAPLAAPPPAAPSAFERPLSCYPISGRSETALAQLVQRHGAALAGGANLADAAHTAGVGRSHFAERVAVVAADSAEVQAALAAFGRSEPHPSLFRGTAVAGAAPEVAFLFTGAGAQYPGMTRLLYATSPVFRDVIDRADAILGKDDAGRTLRTVLEEGTGDNAPIHEMRWTQPALYAVEYGVSELWRSWGIEPAAVIGHSAGELVAAAVAGVFSFDDGLRLIAERARLMHALPPGGTMAAIFAPHDEVRAALEGPAYRGRVSIAAANAADSVVIAGESAAVEAFAVDFERRNIKAHRLYIQLAAHSPLVEPALAPFEAAARAVTMKAPNVPVAWNLTGGAPLPGGAPDAAYWRRHMREPVRFADGISALYKEGYRVFLEVGPHPTLGALAQRTLPEGTAVLASLRRGKDDWRELFASLAELYVRGARVDWRGVDRPYPRQRLALPTYPFERKSWWVQAAAPGVAAAPATPTRAKKGALAAVRLPSAVPIFETTLSPASAKYLPEHRVAGAVLVAGGVFLELAQTAAREAYGSAAHAVEGFAIHEPLVLPDEGRRVQTSLAAPDASGRSAFAIHGWSASGEWALHASGHLLPITPSVGSERMDLSELRATLGAPASAAPHYEEIAGLGIDLGPSFRTVRETRARSGEVLAAIELAPSSADDVVTWIHPALLDGALQTVGFALPRDRDVESDVVHLFTAVERIELEGTVPARAFAHARLRDAERTGPRAEYRADVTLLDEDGLVFGTLRGVCLRRASKEALARATSERDLFYRVVWEPAPAAPRAAASIEDPATFAPAVASRFDGVAAGEGLSVYEDLLPELDRLAGDYAAEALSELGVLAPAGRVFTAESEAARAGIAGRHARLFGRLLDIMVEDGLLARRGGSLEVVGEKTSAGAVRKAPSAERIAALRARFGEVDGELLLLARCGVELAQVLRGVSDPADLLFPGGSLAEARKLYVESPFARTYNKVLANALSTALANTPKSARVRVLEIGAGTGGTTSYVLPMLAGRGGPSSYTFTDVSPHFLDGAAKEFASFRDLERRVFDVERSPGEQGLEAGAYDVVIAANVLHATADLRRSLDHARALLAPGGLFLALEGTVPERWVDLTFGLTHGWWRFSDTSLRRDYPLIDRAAWLGLLADAGWTSPTVIPSDGRGSRAASHHVVLIARAPSRRRRWLLLDAGDPIGATLAERLRDRGDDVTILAADATAATAPSADEIVYLGALATRGPDEGAATVARARALSGELPLAWLARLARGEIHGRAWLVTAGAQPVNAAERGGVDPRQAPLWGVGRGFALEQPAAWGGLVDLSPAAEPSAAATTLLDAIDASDGEDQSAWRGDVRSVARLVRRPAPPTKALVLAADATYLVTGGFGGLGLLVGRWLAEHGARHVALLGRRPDPTSEGVRAIEAAGAKVHALAGDVTDESALAAVLGKLEASAPPLRGIVHAAADLSGAPLGELAPAVITQMLRVKMDATATLERLTRSLPLDFLVLFSSTTALLGASGLAHYAAANAFLDAFAWAHDRPGRRVLSVNWGTWEAMRLASAEMKRGYREGGLEPIPAAEALDGLARLLGTSEPQGVVARVDWSVLKPLHEARRVRPFLARLEAVSRVEPGPPGAAADRASGKPAGAALVERLTGATPTQRHEILVAFVRGEIATVLGAENPEAVPIEKGLFEMGMDSLMSVALKKRLEVAAGTPLPATLTFNYPSAVALAGFLESTLAATLDPPVASVRSVKRPSVAPPSGQASPPSPPADLDVLSEDELEARLIAQLARHAKP